MKKTKISKLSHIMMVLSSLALILNVCIINVYAEENNNEEPVVNEVVNEEPNSGDNNDSSDALDNNLNQVFNAPLDADPVVTNKARIGDNYYATLIEAVNAVVDGTPTTIEVLDDDLNASGIIVPEGRNITFNFNGHTYVVTGNYAGSVGTQSQSFQLLKNSTITMVNGTIKNVGGAVLIQNYANLTLTDMVLDGRENSNVQYALSANNGQVLINGSTSMYVTEGNVAFDMCWAPKVGYPAGTQIVVDTTGTISGIIELDVWGNHDDNVLSTLEIRNMNHVGGYSIDARLAGALSITGTPTSLGSGLTRMGDSYYGRLVDAVAAVNDANPTTIELLGDDLNASGVVIPSGRNITINFNGHTYVVTGNYAGSAGTQNQSFQLLKDSTIVMTNGTIKNVGGMMIVQNYANLTLTNMVLDGRENSNVLYALSSNQGQVLINGSTSMYVTEGNVAFDMCWAPNVGYPAGTQIVVDTTGTISGIIELDVWGAHSDNVLSTLEIRNMNHVGRYSIDSRLAGALSITGDFSANPSALGSGLARVGDSYFGRLVDAVAYVTDDTPTTIELLSSDLNASGIVVPSGRNITFDFHGNTYVVTGNYAGSAGTQNQSFQLLKNSTITMLNGTVKNVGGMMIVQNYANLTLTDMVLDGRENSNVLYALSSNQGQVLINGSTSMYVTEGNVAFDMCWAPNNSYVAGTQMVVDTTGVIFGKIELDTWGGFSNTVPVASTLTINNIKHIGTFQVAASDSDLWNYLTVNGGLFNNSLNESVIGYGYALVPVNNVYVVRKLQSSNLTLVEENENTYLYENGSPVNYTGTEYVSGVLYKFVNGVVDTEFTGVVELDNQLVYLVNGVTSLTTSGLVTVDYKTYLFTNGVSSKYTGTQYVPSEQKRYIFVNGVVDEEYTGVVEVGDKLIYLKNGKTSSSTNGFLEVGDKKYLFANGVVRDFTGTLYIPTAQKRYMFVNGIVDEEYTGVVEADGKLIYIKNGETYTAANGFLVVGDKKYLFANGVVRDFTGTLYIPTAQKRYMFVNGIVDENYTGVVEADGKLIYIKNGETYTAANGFLEVGDNKYLFANGVVRDFTGTLYVPSEQKRCKFVNGVVDSTFNDILEIPELSVLIKFSEGMTDVNFNGESFYNYDFYVFHSGLCFI